MELQIDYGRDGLVIKVPESAAVLKMTESQPLSDEGKAIREALSNPIGKPPLSSLVDSATSVVITHSDITRATPNDRILPVLLQFLEEYGVRREKITLINALGTHRPQTPDEMRSLLGNYIYSHYQCIQHNAFDDSELVPVGRTSFGNEIRLNKTLLEANLKIFTGFIEPHFFAGFSGGPKAVLPALAGFESVYSNHGYKHISSPSATFTVTHGNPIWEEMRQAAEKVENTFLLNVTLDRSRRITGVFAGDVIPAHEEGCKFQKAKSVVKIEEPFDIVITSNSGYPLDQNLYQCVKGLSAAKRAVRKGGAILLAARCEDGLPSHGKYAALLEQGRTPEGILNMINKAGFISQDSWQVQVQAYVQQHADVFIYSEGLSDFQIRCAMMNPVRDINSAIKDLQKKYGKRICVIPEGPLVVVNQHS
ncbi:MAG TPA: nickel-dependent lactate racemase [Anaerolineaceae bacterium]|nr:nickel-dependent lactate racemase [Anaerolineaceae bacterium]